MRDAEAETGEAALGDLSFAAAAFDWQAVGVRDDATPADAHLPLAIVVAHGVTAFAALVLMFADAGWPVRAAAIGERAARGSPGTCSER